MTYNNGARVEIDAQCWKFTDGALVYNTLIEDDFGFAAADTIANNGQEESTVINNTITLNLGFDGTLKVIADQNSTDGKMTLFLERSDLDANWPSDLADFDIQDLTVLCVLPMSTDAEDEGRAKNFRYQ